ncbi:MAG: nucleotide exchange factor GrpE [Erysipelotrichaceae bacterium]|jgi:molecular chaperone GrpE|nr:nucleotide exchange factor GrpE [Erysipelotrichaceae bacterium]
MNISRIEEEIIVTPNEEKENIEGLEEELNEEENFSKKEKKKIAKLEEELEKAKADCDHWKNEYYRAYADTKNLRSSLERDHKEALKYRAEGFIEELLPILDSFHMALGNEPTDPALKNYLTGFQFIYKNLVNVLTNEGVTEITPEIETDFNPATMQAVDSVEAEEAGKITKVYGKGYKLRDRLIRPAMVQVSVKKKESQNEESVETDA